MRAQNVYDIMNNLKKSTPETMVNGNRLLKYIYQDIYRDYFKKNLDKIAKEHNVGSTNYQIAARPYLNLQKELSEYMDCDSSIITYFNEIISDNKQEFITAFFDKANTMFDMIDNHYYDDSDFKVFSCVFNLYTMLKAYHEHKDNYEVFSKILDDSNFLLDCDSLINLGYYSSINPSLTNRKKLLDKILESKAFGESKRLQEELKDCLKFIGDRYKFDGNLIATKIEVISSFDIVYQDYMDLKKENSVNKLIPIENVFDEMWHRMLERLFYCKSLLIGNRFKYINNVLYSYLSNKSTRESVFSTISKLDYHFFDYLNSIGKVGTDGDSFISCMKVIFDSDTSFELESKLDAIKNASFYYSNNQCEKALSYIESLNDIKHKKVYDNHVVAYGANAINSVNKPEKLVDRMNDLYLKMYPDLQIKKLLKTASVESYSLHSFGVMFESSLNKAISDEEEKRRKIQEQQNQEASQEKNVTPGDNLDNDINLSNPNSSISVTTQRLNVADTPEKATVVAPMEEGTFKKIKSIFGRKN